jgi:hypothetical protein
MNARVFMVLVFSSVFMGIWNSDQKAMDSTIARNKRLNKPIAVFPMPSVETVQREKMSAVDFSVPEPRPVRIAMRASNDVGRNEPVIERHDQQAQQHSAAQGSVVNLTPVPEGSVSEDGGNAIEANAVDEAVEALSVNTLVSEPTAGEIVATESELVAGAESSIEESKTEESASSTESSVSNESVQGELKQELAEESVPRQEELIESVSEEVVAGMPATESTVTEPTVSATAVDEIESSSVPAPEDFSVEGTADSRTVETVTESVPTEDVATEETAVEAVESEVFVTAEVAVMVAENSADETGVDHSGDGAVQNEQSVTGATEAELPEPADPIAVEAVESDTSETNEDEKSLEDKLLQSGEYDMLDVHAEDVIPGNVEPAVDGGATCIPLPRNLASGTWQVIHSSGEFFRITVDRGGDSSGKYSVGDKDVLETSFCITTTPDGVRWCFIRSFVDSPVPVRRVTTEFFSPGQQ